MPGIRDPSPRSAGPGLEWGTTVGLIKRGIAAVCTLSLAGCAAAPPAPQDYAALDAEVRQRMAAGKVEGLALAVIEQGQVVHVAAYGRRSVERDLPLQTDTVMYGASLTKAAVGYYVAQLVDRRRLDLDAPVTALLPRSLPTYEEFTDLAGDERWRLLTPRMLLNHTTGFANFRWLEQDQRLQFHFAPGQRYGYSGEGFYLLQLVIEAGLGLDLGREMQDRLFTPFGLVRTSLQWRADFADNLADGYRDDGSLEPHDERSRVSAAGSMDTTIADQARLWAAFVRGDGLSREARAEWARGQVPITSPHQFPTLDARTEPRNVASGLAAGLGVVAFRGPAGPGFFKGGHNDSTGNMVVCLERGLRCVVLLANDVRAERLYPGLVERVLGATGLPWRWEYGWYDPAVQ
jgi:CubicO group peptidase (beta-lactamase class C family)